VILVVSHPGDDHAIAVLDVLAGTGRHVEMLDTGRFPAQMAITQHFGPAGASASFEVDGHRIALDEARSVWWRRPQPFRLHEGLDPSVVGFTYGECNEAVAGLWDNLDAAWVNAPPADEAAHHKPHQLRVAAEVGLTVPRTVITNDPACACAFAAELRPGRTIYKTFLATEEHWRETRLLRPEDEAHIAQLRLAPAIFQEYVPAVADLRVTVVGDQIFAAAVASPPGGYEYDYRMQLGDAIIHPTHLDPRTEKALVALMQRLGIMYGAADFRRTAEGDEVFLEVNPAGEWRFVEERTAQPITEAMASLLADLDAHHG